ncbi:response regulator transcription factor [Pseudoalteromonas phenolica]|uniref:Response regulator in two-component regulatory system with PhoQ n=1 Tax=Pseudoalteromonas phenolica TaxID=161398 RepID=A0A0S2K345_9GAMM|nr:response regulator transcription factor [Pseudoalteromonas phenolica]ALO42370.1 Response regulator in two-component regulatory system with PhoQ [Pseudoalteromonas phenolica]MBE0356534.1 two-component system, OmpR family, response regulator PhoP [Pseudoalteromonas phenolica O-BC30]RXE97009.1 DNA-binding response regulator [Pseudoalteromonas phenolica O-BC30]TMO54202.1 DNA-binding response regulator [Pseudoalteromonas phenolica]
MRILVIEDDIQLAENLRSALEKEKYSIDLCHDGESGLFHLQEYPLDLAVVDLGLPKLDGIELIKRARKAGVTIPILILTARERWQDKVEGLDAGADDYLTKPFHVEELVARCNALIRRSAGQANPEINIGPVKIHTRSQQVWVNEKELTLTAYEYKVLEYLMVNPQKVISKSELTEHIYDQDFDLDSNVIEVFVLRLRKKLDPDGTLNPVETLRGRGYRFKNQW